MVYYSDSCSCTNTISLDKMCSKLYKWSCNRITYPNCQVYVTRSARTSYVSAFFELHFLYLDSQRDG